MKKDIQSRSQDAGTIATIEQLFTRVRASRNASGDEGAFDYGLAKLLRPAGMKGVDQAVQLLEHSLRAEEKILIVGDFDADGATSTALCLLCLQALGAKVVEYLVPNRFEYGYGLTPEIVEVAARREPALIVTVDNGISSIEGVAKAKALGIRVLVTDHHLPGDVAPEADAIVNPNQHGCNFESKNLAGVGVVFYVMTALRARLRETNWFEARALEEPNLGKYLDLVALGTVADVVPLDYNNRILVANGLQRMRAGQTQPGIKAIMDVANKRLSTLGASDLGFAVGPRLNAAGRLDDMSLGIKTLTTPHVNEARQYAQELDDLNGERKLIESSMQEEAKKILASMEGDDSQADIPDGVCLYKSDWHQGVIGILASRVKDRLHRPTIVFAEADDSELKGSGRSIPGVHLRDVLDEIATKNPGLLNKFGGHAMAAGLSLNKTDLEVFTEQFDRCVSRHLSEELRSPIVLSDGELAPHLISMISAQAIQDAGPWGQHFPEPLFDGVFAIVSQRIVGQKHLKMTLMVEGAGEPLTGEPLFDAIAFNVDLDVWGRCDVASARIVYKLDINEFRGSRSVQLMVEYMAPV